MRIDRDELERTVTAELRRSETCLQRIHPDNRDRVRSLILDRVLVSITDITERKWAEEALQKAQAELAHVTRVTAMGVLTSSTVREVNQPLAALVTNGGAAVRWLSGGKPDRDRPHAIKIPR